MATRKVKTVKRWSGSDWADCIETIGIIGLGGIGSWVALATARIDHNLILIDGDSIDDTNVSGGQLYRASDIGRHKVEAIRDICRSFGCNQDIEIYPGMYKKEACGSFPITICGLDNMKARKEVFEEWEKNFYNKKALFIDGRLLLENMEIFSIDGRDIDAIAEYKKSYLFDDSEVPDTDCTVKQCTFSAMSIASLITATLVNWLTNNKLDMQVRAVPFYQNLFLPIFNIKHIPNVKEKSTFQAASS